MNRPTLTFTTFTINVEVNVRIKFNVHEIKLGDGNHLKDGDEGPEGVANTALGDFWPCFDVKFFGNARISEFLRFQNLKTYVQREVNKGERWLQAEQAHHFCRFGPTNFRGKKVEKH